MKERIIKDQAASIKGKLYNACAKMKVVGPMMYMRYFLERLLYRMMNSKYKDKFIVRGSSLLYILNKITARQTKDLDFMGVNIDNDLEYMKRVFQEIIAVPCPEDYVEFLPETLNVEEIQSNKTYSGIRVSVVGKLSNIREKVSLDIGYDDVITPKPKLMEYPIILNTMPGFEVLTYTIETSLAEKIETIITRGELNTRMKDYYDIWYIMNNIPIDMDIFNKAMENTFKHRNATADKNSVVFDITFYLDENRIKMWNSFIKKAGVDYISFYDVGLYIITNVKPII